MRKEAENKAGDREENQGTMSTKPREESLEKSKGFIVSTTCLLYTSDAADDPRVV